MLGELLKFGDTGLMSKDPRVSIHGLEAKQYEGECVLLNKELTQLFKLSPSMIFPYLINSRIIIDMEIIKNKH